GSRLWGNFNVIGFLFSKVRKSSMITKRIGVMETMIHRSPRKKVFVIATGVLHSRTSNVGAAMMKLITKAKAALTKRTLTRTVLSSCGKPTIIAGALRCDCERRVPSGAQLAY